MKSSEPRRPLSRIDSSPPAPASAWDMPSNMVMFAAKSKMNTVVPEETNKLRRQFSFVDAPPSSASIGDRLRRTSAAPVPLIDVPAKKHSRLVIRPTSRLRLLWDCLSMACLLYTTFVTSFEICFVEGEVQLLSASFLIGRSIDFVFGVDIVLNFFTAFFNQQSGETVYELRRIMPHYFCTWFFPDLIATVPWDIIIDAALDRDIEGSKMLKLPRVLKLLRLSRLFKLLRVLRISRVFNRWEARLGIRYGVVRLIKFLVAVLVCAHWNACVWYLVASLQLLDDTMTWDDTWMGRKGLAPGTPVSDLYFGGLYWAVMTLTSIGYGDITAFSVPERITAIILMFIDASLFAYIVGSVTHLVQSLNIEDRTFEAKMDQLNEYMKTHRIPRDLQMRVRDYVHKSHQHASAYDSRLLQDLSPDLRGEVVAWGYQDIFQKVPYFEGMGLDFFISLAVTMRPETFAPGEVVYKEKSVPEKFYLVRTGTFVVRSEGHILRRLGEGACFGEEVLLSSECRSTLVARTHCCVISVTKDCLTTVLRDHPEVAARIRSNAARRLWQKIASLRRLGGSTFAHKLASIKAKSLSSGGPGTSLLQRRRIQATTRVSPLHNRLGLGTLSYNAPAFAATPMKQRRSPALSPQAYTGVPPSSSARSRAPSVTQNDDWFNAVWDPETVKKFDHRLSNAEKMVVDVSASLERIERSVLSLRGYH